jgi:hypothetical protein
MYQMVFTYLIPVIPSWQSGTLVSQLRTYSIPPAGNKPVAPVRVFITHASLCDVCHGRDAGMWVEPEAVP